MLKLIYMIMWSKSNICAHNLLQTLHQNRQKLFLWHDNNIAALGFITGQKTPQSVQLPILPARWQPSAEDLGSCFPGTQNICSYYALLFNLAWELFHRSKEPIVLICTALQFS